MFYKSKKYDKIKKHINSKLKCLERIHTSYNKNKGISWITKNNKVKEIKFDFQDVSTTLENPWVGDFSWLGDNKKDEMDFFRWIREFRN